MIKSQYIPYLNTLGHRFMRFKIFRLLVLLFVLTNIGLPLAQCKSLQNEEKEVQFNQSFQKAQELSSSFLYADALEEYAKAIEIAKDNGLHEERISAQISLAELLRSTRDFDHAYRLITSIEGVEQFPYLQVRLFGRLAAIYHEKQFPDEMKPYDSVHHYLKLAIPIAEREGFELEEAALKNELGQWLYTRTDPKEAEPYLIRSSDIFKRMNDTANYVNVMGNLIDCYYDQGLIQKGNDLAFFVLDMVREDKWTTLRPRIYDLLSEQAKKRGDSLDYYRWEKSSLDGKLLYVQMLKEKQLSKLLVLNETQRLIDQKQEAERLTFEKEEELRREEKRRRELFIYLAILVVLVIGVFFLLWRENRLKVELDKANNRYQLLVVESNHRIKNNLQMVVSMLRFAKKDKGKSKEDSIAAISNKIHIISSLHEHLHMDILRQKLSLKVYFKEIVDSYLEMDPSIDLESSVDPIEIDSERIVYLGLILNEMLSNTIEHNGSEQKRVSIVVKKENQSNSFYYTDYHPRTDGVQNNTGMLLIKRLIGRLKGKDFSISEDSYTYNFEFDA